MSGPAAPEPDTKDWTWVITAPCADCGFDPAAVTHDGVPEDIRRCAGALVLALERSDAGERSAPTTWSPLEYACHVRDVCAMFLGRLDLMLTRDDPEFENWDQDDTAIAERYWKQQPATVATQLATQADALAQAFAAVHGEQWTRPGRRSNGSVFTVDTLARYLLHDLAHHAWDVGAPDR